MTVPLVVNNSTVSSKACDTKGPQVPKQERKQEKKQQPKQEATSQTDVGTEPVVKLSRNSRFRLEPSDASGKDANLGIRGRNKDGWARTM